MMMNSDQALKVLELNSRSFYFASRMLSSVHRQRAARLYTFCRWVDDLADESNDCEQATNELNSIRTAIETGQATMPCVADMLEIMREADIPLQPVLALLDGVQSDMHLGQIKTEAQLLRYAYRVAGTVGVMMSMLLDVREPEALPFAIDLGIAMQLTNIARDVGEDASKGRVYLPEAWVGVLDPQEVVAPSIATADRLRAGTQQLLAFAERYYESGLSGVSFLPSSARYGILVAGIVYKEIGQVIAEMDYQSWAQRAIVSHSRKLVCASKALTSYTLQNRSCATDRRHDRHLHEHLHDCFGVAKTTLA